jgi:hypothetical protein
MRYWKEMSEPDENVVKQNYRWPWFLAAGVLLGIVLAVVWVGYAAHREAEERNFSAPLPSQAR